MPIEAYDFVDEQHEWSNTRLPGADHARRMLEMWKIIAVGRRPIDYMGRDLLIAPWLRDPRIWAMRKFSKGCPKWAGEMTREFFSNPPARKQAIQILGTMFLHYAHLVKLARESDEEAIFIINRLMRCWPYGAQFQWLGRERKSNEDICKMPRQCPYCLARMTCDLYARISGGPLHNRQSGVLILGRHRGTEYLVPDDSEELNQQVRKGKFQRTQELIREAKEYGATGGMVTFLMAPGRFGSWSGNEVQPDTEGLSFDICILGAVRSPTRAFTTLVDNPSHGSSDWLIRRNADRSALRFLLAGTSVASRLAHGDHGDVGAFTVESWPLSTFAQWWGHYRATKGLHLYHFWGDWIGHVPPTVRRPRLFLNFTGGRRRRAFAFQKANSSRSEAALARRRSMLAAAQLVWNQMLCDRRVTGWRPLKSALAAAGTIVSERDARWLVNQFKEDNFQGASDRNPIDVA